MAPPKLAPRFTPNAHVEMIERGWRLSIPSGKADRYRFAQLDDYAQIARARFPHRAQIELRLSARVSSDSIPGTWGFGLWNDPFGLSLGFGGNPFRLPALPNAAWFFGASEENYLSFKSIRADRRSKTEVEARAPGRPSTSLHSTQDEVANGFMAQVFRSPKFHPLLIPAAMALPVSRRATRRMLGRIIGEDGFALRVDVTQWHSYNLTWGATRVSFDVDHAPVFESAMSPRPPLGLVIWIDNQYAAFTPEGKIAMGVLQNETAWLEIRDLELSSSL